jgi:hypothetical protein
MLTSDLNTIEYTHIIKYKVNTPYFSVQGSRRRWCTLMKFFSQSSDERPQTP